ncbi:hypothetical protein ES708_07795 [subsurface metagenome]
MGEFSSDIETSVLSKEDSKWVHTLYHQAFPSLKQIIKNDNLALQQKGVDLIFLCKDGLKVKVEEKIRNKYYPDILIEEYSNWERKTPGWGMNMELITEYLAYIVLPKQFVYIMYYPALRRLFQENHTQWLSKNKRQFGTTKDEQGNILYHTSNIPVSVKAFPLGWWLTNAWEYSYHLKESL